MSIKKSIFIVRHGHSDFDAELDFDRQLTKNGIEAVNKTAIFINRKCAEEQIVLELCLCSAAQRTQQTAQLICQSNEVKNCQSYKELYSTDVNHWLKKISQTEEENIIIVGHNPTFSQMVYNLCGHEFHMKPADCALISLEIKPDGFIYPATLVESYQNE